jgi:hypothetical protein
VAATIKGTHFLSPVRIERHDDWIEAFFDSIGQSRPFGDVYYTIALTP